VQLFLPYFNEACILASAVAMALGWFQIRRRRVEAHRRLMLTGVVLAALFFVTYVAKTLLIGDTAFGGPERWRLPYQVFLQVHSVLATVAAILGIITLRAAYRENFSLHRRIGPWTASIWFITAASGLVVFLLLYIIFPPGPTTDLFRAWIGH
jgi:putative membrane protein